MSGFLAVIVFGYMAFHQGSLFLAAACMGQIVLSIPISLVILKCVLGIDYFCALHIFVIILIMGIGADDIFVFHDHWCHTKHIKILRKRYPLRLAYTFRKAVSAMLVTSVTTAVSFVATCISPIMPIVSFGVFACIVVITNYFLIILIVPSIYLFYEIHVRPNFRCFRAL